MIQELIEVVEHIVHPTGRIKDLQTLVDGGSTDNFKLKLEV